MFSHHEDFATTNITQCNRIGQFINQLDYIAVNSCLKMLCVALLKAVGMLWLKLDISGKKLKQDSRLLAVFRVTATNLPLSATWGLSHSPARMD